MLPLSWEASVSIWDTKVSFFQGLGTVLRSSRGSLGALHCTSNSSHFDEQPRESVWHSSEVLLSGSLAAQTGEASCLP